MGRGQGTGGHHIAARRVDDPVEFRNNTSLNHTLSPELQ